MTRFIVTAILAAAVSATAARADLTGRTMQPHFTPAEVAFIEQNAALKDAVTSDPWAVRQVLDALAAGRSAQDGRSDDPGGRAAAEAIHDLLDRLKQAGQAVLPK